MIVEIPNNFIDERKYILKIILSDFLGLNFDISIDNATINYVLILENSKKIIIKDAFFNNFSNSEYLQEANIPSLVIFAKNRFYSEEELPILYGNNELIEEKDSITYGNDIFAASFFMLTRWEEFVIKQKDEFGRFPEEMALSIKHGFHIRPVVNQYVEMLWNMLISLGFQQKRKTRKYQLKITHDVDFFKKYDSFSKISRSIIGDILKRKSLNKIIETLTTVLKIYLKKEKDPFDVFDFFMNVSENNGLQSHFYFIPSVLDKYSTYSIENKQLKAIIQQIIDRKHIIGYHASWLAFENTELFEKEVNILRNLGIKITEGRQHYLRFKVPDTWKIWEQFGLEEDSSLGFSNTIGFRTGTCYEYKVFDILSKKELNLCENPLIAMDSALLKCCKSNTEMQKKIYDIAQVVKKYNGNFVLLWHNNNINCNFGKNFDAKYVDIINQVV